jgi:hypothetical protein
MQAVYQVEGCARYIPYTYHLHTIHIPSTYHIIIIIIIIFSVSAAQRVLWPSRSRGFFITRSDAPQSVGLICTSDQLVTETST